MTRGSVVVPIAAALLVIGLSTSRLVVTTQDPSERVRAELSVFTDWLEEQGVRGHIGEFGWPNDEPADQTRYDTLGDRYIRDMRAAGLRGTQWATGEWWGSDYHLSVYERSSVGGAVDTPGPQARILERHADIVGIQVNGGEFGAPSGITPTAEFSNVHRGTYDRDWHYDSQQTFDYLASRGLEQVVIPFRWERIQTRPGGRLDPAELARMKGAIARAGAAGLTSIPIVANYGAYWLHDPSTGRGVRRAIGTTHITIVHYADLWTKLSAALDRVPNVAAYGLMREPIGQPGATNRDQAGVWEAASQAAVNAIRANGDERLLLVPGYRYSNAHSWPEQHPDRWIVDPAGNHVYEAHHYWDRGHSGEYGPYDELS